MSGFEALAQQCAPAVHPTTMAAVVRIESTFNPFAIGVVGGRLERQPMNKAEAIATARALEASGYNFSLGIGQVNRHNLSRYGLNYQTAFDPCANLTAASLILKDCYDRAKAKGLNGDGALQAAFSCYYSGNFSTGFQAGVKGQLSYVRRVLDGAATTEGLIRVIPGRIARITDIESTIKARVGNVVRVTAEVSSDGPAVEGPRGVTSDSVKVYR